MNQKKEKRYSLTRETFTRLMKNRLAMFGLFILCVLVITAIFADQIAPYSYDQMDLLNAYKAPCKGHIFGTDEFGREHCGGSRRPSGRRCRVLRRLDG